VKACKAALAKGKSVVIDNTNATTDLRKLYIDCATEAGTCFGTISHLGPGPPHYYLSLGTKQTTDATVRCFHFMAEYEMASHLNMFREKTGGKKHVSRIAYNLYKSKFKAPTVKEGFTDVVEVTFVAEFDDDATRKQFEQQT
jgi:bifunctional polynucleotide phosphatase/kinase